MKRELLTFLSGLNTSGCCPGCDKYPDSKYKNNRSARARARDIKKEHKYVRTLVNRMIYSILKDYDHIED